MTAVPRKPFSAWLLNGVAAFGCLFFLGNLIFMAPLLNCPLLADHVPFDRFHVWSMCPLCRDRNKVTVYEKCAWKLEIFRQTLRGGHLSK